MKSAKIRYLILVVFWLLIPLTSLYSQNNQIDDFNKAKLLMMEGQYSRSAGLLQTLLNKDFTNSDILYYLGLNYQSLSNFQMASKFFEQALKLDTANVKLMTLLGNDYYSAGRTSDADSILSKAFALDSSDTQVLLAMGKTYKKEQNWKEAKDIYNKLIGQDSTNGFYYEQLAYCNANLKDFNEAIINFQISHQLNPLNQNIILDLSQIYFSKELFVSAMHIIDDGLAVYPYSTSFWTKKGDINLKMKNYSDAVDEYQKSISFGDSSEINFRNMGIAYYWIEEYNSSITSLDQAVKIMDKDPSAYFYLGASYKNLKKYDLAIKNLSLASDLQRNDFMAETLIQIAATYYEQKNYSQALKFYQDALREKPDKKEIVFYLATAYYHYYKDKTVAIKYYNKFLADTIDVDKQLIKYAKDRKETLIEENHFRKAETPK